MEITFVTTGGTIDKVYYDAKSRYEVGESVIEHMLRQGEVHFEHRVIALMRKDSLEMTDRDRQLIRASVEADPGRLFVITHGTDTMVETARALSGLEDKVVVLTGALNPARFQASDAMFNIGMAVAAVQVLEPGVYLAMNGRIFDPRRVRKNRELNRFEPLDQTES
jgi:L-asparaginase